MKRFVLIVGLVLALLVCAGCAQAETPAETGAPPEAGPSPVAEEAAAAPEEEAAPQEEKELPTPPDVDISSWEFLYASPDQGVSRYHPAVRNWESQYMDDRCADATIEFMSAARTEGYTVWIGVGYRNFEYSLFWYENAIREYGSAFEAAKHVFPAGCSEHSTGLAFDITDESIYHANYYDMHDETVADTEVYQWMAEHCTDYGFIVRYPEGHEEHYGMACYPGHFRYVGVEAAQYIMENDICFEEFLALYEE